MIIREIPAVPKEKKNTRVAAYARVSADKDAAFHSLSAQTEYYEQYIAKHPDWELVGLYSDNGVSGTISDRPEFQRMLQDCRDGKIDLVITKSVTRFARNTVVLLETIRELKALGVDCFFEKENMHSISPDGELLLTLLAMYAEEEARSASENQKWRIKKRFENGEPWVGNMLGYRLVDRQLVIVPEEAEIVRRIFDEYLSGKGLALIAKQLNAEAIPALGNKKLSRLGLHHILRNEKYAGDMLLQKTYRKDFRTKKNLKNKGEVRMYKVENSHEPIVSREVFNQTQMEIARRKTVYVRNKGTASNNSAVAKSKYLFTGLLTCGICGNKYRRIITHKKDYPRPAWICKEFDELGKINCPSQKIREDILIQKTQEVLQVEEVDRTIIEEQIEMIIVPEHNHLVYHLKNGDIVDVPWENRSRRESWTPEMRQKARERMLQRYRKEDK